MVDMVKQSLQPGVSLSCCQRWTSQGRVGLEKALYATNTALLGLGGNLPGHKSPCARKNSEEHP